MQELANIAGMTASAIESGKLVWVVRCKDCKNHGTMDCPMCEEGNCIFHTADNWYCADGERKEGR